MKSFFILIASVLFWATSPAAAGEHPKIRKALAITACAATSLDFMTTTRANGLVEANPLFSGPSGKPALLSLGLAKAAGCGLGLWFAFHHPAGRSDLVGIWTTAASSALLGGIGFHNLLLERKQ